MTTPVKIPKRTAYKAADVCAIVELQPYVLRTWEAEFPDLGVQQSNGRARIYRRSDLDKVLRIKELIVVEGASHLFEESGTLEAVADAARDWFVECFES